MTINNCTITVGQRGAFDAAGQWVTAETITLTNNKTLNMTANETYRIRIASISALPSQSELDANGYKSTVDSIRN